MIAVASVKEVGVKVSETNISTTSAWRHRKSNREAEAKSIKENFTPSQISALHWDEKIITLMRKGKTHFVVVYLTEVGENQPQKLLGVPQAPSEKGKDESKVVRDCVLKWDAKDVVGAFAFDTPPSITGEKEGVCSYLASWIGYVLWSGC